jgi:RNA polymerase sigma-32 factor
MQNHNFTVAPTDFQTVSSRCSRAYSDGYARAVRRYRLLEQEQEQQLARRRRKLGEQKAADELITSHLRRAATIARRYQGYGLPLPDIIAEANLGLVIAASRFEPGRGARFSTYAKWWIKAAIHDYILRSWSLVKIGTTRAQRKLFFGLRREMRKLARDPVQLNAETAELIAHKLDVTPQEVIEMDCRLGGDISINKPIANDESRNRRMGCVARRHITECRNHSHGVRSRSSTNSSAPHWAKRVSWTGAAGVRSSPPHRDAPYIRAART